MELIDRLLFSSDTMGGAIGFTPAHTAPNEAALPEGLNRQTPLTLSFRFRYPVSSFTSEDYSL